MKFDARMERGGSGLGEDTGRQELLEFIESLRRGWWVILASCVFTVAAAWYSMSQRDPVYTADVLLQHSESPSLAAVASPIMGVETLDFASQLEIIRSRAVLETAVDSLGLQLVLRDHEGERSQIIQGVEVDHAYERANYQLVRTGSRVALVDPRTGRELVRASEGEWLELPGFRLLVNVDALDSEPVSIAVTDFEVALDQLKRRLVVEPGLGSALLWIRYSDPDPVHSAAVANIAARAYESFRASSAREAAAVRREFLANRLVEITDSLSRVQQHLLDYQQSERSLNPALESNVLINSLTQAENQVRQLRFEVGLLESLVATLDADPQSEAGLQRLVALGSSILPGGAELYSRIQELTAQRNSLTSSRFGQTSQSAQVEVLDSLRASTWRHVRALADEALDLHKVELSNAESQVTELRASVGEMPEKSAEFEHLAQQVDAVQNIFDRLLENYYEAQIAEAVETGDVRIVDAAAIPLRPDPVSFELNLIIAAIVGLLLGGGGVGVRHHLDTRISRADHAERAADLDILSMIPHLNGGKKRSVQVAGEEAFRWLATSVRFVEPERSLVVAVTSAAPSEGKSTVAVNLAVSSASMGRRVLLVDADFRKPVLHETFQIDRAPGLTDVLTGAASIAGVIHGRDGSGPDLLTCGSVVVDPVSTMTRGGYSRLLDHLRSHYDLVIIDTAPVLAVAESIVVCAAADGVLFAVRANQTDQRAVLQATTKIRRMKGKLIGLVLTDVPVGTAYSRASYRYYEYGSYYGTKPDPESRFGRRRRAARLLPGLSRGIRP